MTIENYCYPISAKPQKIKQKCSETLILNERGRIFDKKKIEEQQELATAFGEKTFRLAHNLPDDGSGRI